MANTDFRNDLDDIDLLDVWGEGRIVTSGGMVTGFPRAYIINKFDQRLSNSSVSGPMKANMGTPLTDIIDKQLFLGVQNYDSPTFPIKDGIVHNLTLMGAPIVDRVAQEMFRVLNKDDGRIILYAPDQQHQKILENNTRNLKVERVDTLEFPYNEPTIRPIFIYRFRRRDEL